MILADIEDSARCLRLFDTCMYLYLENLVRLGIFSAGQHILLGSLSEAVAGLHFHQWLLGDLFVSRS